MFDIYHVLILMLVCVSVFAFFQARMIRDNAVEEAETDMEDLRAEVLQTVAERIIENKEFSVCTIKAKKVV